MVYFVFVDVPGKPAVRTTIAVEAVRGYVDTQGREVPARYDELVPNQEGLISLDPAHQNHARRLDVLSTAQKKFKRRNEDLDCLIGPFDSIKDALKAKYEARPKTEKEQLQLASAATKKLENENLSLREAVEKLKASNAPKKKATSKKVAPQVPEIE